MSMFCESDFAVLSPTYHSMFSKGRVCHSSVWWTAASSECTHLREFSVFRSTCPWKEGVPHSALKHKLGRGAIGVHLCQRLHRANQRFISRVQSILTENPEDNLQSQFYGLHCDLLLRSWVNDSFLLKEKEGILNDKTLLWRKKNDNGYEMPNSVSDTSHILYKWQLILLCSSNHESFVVSIQ